MVAVITQVLPCREQQLFLSQQGGAWQHGEARGRETATRFVLIGSPLQRRPVVALSKTRQKFPPPILPISPGVKPGAASPRRPP